MIFDAAGTTRQLHATVASMMLAIAGLAACTAPDASPADSLPGATAADSFGGLPTSIRTVRVRARRDLVESSAAAASVRQQGIVFTINDSGNEPLLFALDTTGADRGAWRISGATNVDWESLAVGPCGNLGRASDSARLGSRCLYIGDTGDNESVHATRVIYRVPEPNTDSAGALGAITAERLVYRYADGPRDVEAMYVAPDGTINLITKRALKDSGGSVRPALIYTMGRAAWQGTDIAVATLADSLAIVPTQGPFRQVTDAALSPDARLLAVRTYFHIYIFEVNPRTGIVRRATPPSLCNIAGLEERVGEGIGWLLPGTRLVLTSEGRNEPLHIVQCPLPAD